MISRSARYRSILFEHGGDILASREMQFEHIFMQHGTTSCYTHSVNVACMSLWLAERLRIRVDRRSMVRGALLHDFLHQLHHAERTTARQQQRRNGVRKAEKLFGIFKGRRIRHALIFCQRAKRALQQISNQQRA